jgi:response regulator RpfG family c-di-GMP phosphodiesterase
VRDYFLAQRGLQFDPALVDILLGHWETIKSLRDGHPIPQQLDSTV